MLAICHKLSLIPFLAFLLVSVASAEPGMARKVFSFEQAKKKLYGIPFGQEFYCGCPFDGKIDFLGCPFRSDRPSERASRVEAEHVVPASQFGHQFKEYRLGDKRCRTSKGVLYSGRKCLIKVNKEYQRIHNDLHNLRPAVGIVNGDRSDIPYGEIPGVTYRYPGCIFEWTKEKVEPRGSIKGDIARIYFYMSESYPTRVKVDRDFQQMLQRWSNDDPVDEKECEVERWINAIQGNRNRFIFEHCRK